MRYPEINELFAYYRNIDFALDVMRTGLVYFPKPSQFNDPFDCAIPISVDYDPAEYIKAVVNTGRKDRKSKNEILHSISGEITDDLTLCTQAVDRINESAAQMVQENADMGILCLTEDPLSVLMWSHYGDKHRGICLGFIREAGNDLGNDDACSKVVYSDTFPVARFLNVLRADGSLTESLMLTKARQWAYEKEWRMMTSNGDRKIAAPGRLSKIIVGCATVETVVEDCRIEAERLGIPLQRATKVDGMFALELTNA